MRTTTQDTQQQLMLKQKYIYIFYIKREQIIIQNQNIKVSLLKCFICCKQAKIIPNFYVNFGPME